MYEFIKGTLREITPTYAVVETSGIGYKIFIPLSCYSELKMGDICLYLSFVVREDSMRLFGFLTREERDFFEKLCTISGIGPKTALSMIGHMNSSELKSAIQTGNTQLLTRIPGIGKKTADRIIVELSDHIHKWKAVEPGPKAHLSDALSALINLGYKLPEAQKAIQKAVEQNKEELSLSKLITAALKNC